MWPSYSFYRARYYNPGFQRFISEDPIGFIGGINKYVYVLNSATNFNDRSGLDKKERSGGCPPVPPHLDRMNVDQNIAEEESNAPLPPNLFGAPLALGDVYQKVEGHGPWDCKQNFNLDDSGARVYPSHTKILETSIMVPQQRRLVFRRMSHLGWLVLPGKEHNVTRVGIQQEPH